MKNLQDNIIARIQLMESYFDQLRYAVQISPESIASDGTLLAMLHAITDYYEGGQWLEDYDRDANGELPIWLKRGVLSQDGVYELLDEIKIPR